MLERLHERKVTQNLSNATTKIQLNSIPEKKTSKRETFSLFGKRAKRREKRYESCSQTSLRLRPRQEFLFCYFYMHLFSLSFQTFPPFYLFCTKFFFLFATECCLHNWCEARKHVDISSLGSTQTRGKSGRSKMGE